MSEDLTIIYYTSNRLEHVRPWFAQAVREQLIQSTNGDFPIICVSHEPLEFGDRNIVVGPVERGHVQIYKNILIGTLAANSDSAYIGLAEDDALYTRSHWTTHRPPPNKFSYDFNKWGINSWVSPAKFGYRNRPVINGLIAPRDLLIESLEERFAKFKNVPIGQIPTEWWGDLGRFEKKLGCTPREWEAYAAPDPSIVFSHDEAFGFLNLGKRKSVGKAQCTELPYWGTAERVMGIWNNGSLEEMAGSLPNQPGPIP